MAANAISVVDHTGNAGFPEIGQESQPFAVGLVVFMTHTEATHGSANPFGNAS